MSNTRRFLLFISLIFVCWFIGRFIQVDFKDYKDFILQFPVSVSGLVFVVLYVAVTLFVWLAKDWFKIIGAVVYGAYVSTFLIWIAEIINAVLLFSLSRRLGRELVEEKVKGKLRVMGTLSERNNFGTIFILRLIHLIPFRFLDLGCGLTKIPLRQYLLIVVLASPLPIFFIQFVLAGVGESILNNPSLPQLCAALMEYFSKNQTVLWWGFAYAVVSVVLMVILRKKIPAF